jgi:ABC-2 type transport system ATP-binding protein
MEIEVNNLVKVYPPNTVAVDGISFEVSAGEVFGLLGPNGAGKTTILNILTTLIPRTSGRVMVAGYNLDQYPAAIRGRFGYALQPTPGVITLDVGFTVRDNLTLHAKLQGISGPEIPRRVEEAAKALGIGDIIDKKVSSLSGGLARRVEIARALVHRPSILFLDEPTTGLDPQSRRALWDLLEQKRQSGTTILLTTHYMDEADQLADKVAIIHEGRIVANDTPAALESAIGGDIVTVTLLEDVSNVTVGAAARILSAFSENLRVSGHTITLTVDNAGRLLSPIALSLGEARIAVAQLTFSQPTLEDVFLELTGTRLRDDQQEKGASR